MESSTPASGAATAGAGGEDTLTCEVAADCPRKQNLCRSSGASQSALNFARPTCEQGRCLYENTLQECGERLRCRSCASPEDSAVCYEPSSTGDPGPACASASGGAAGHDEPSSGSLTFGACATKSDCEAPPNACEATSSLADQNGTAVNYTEPTCVGGLCKVEFSRQPCMAKSFEACGIACANGGPPKAYCYFTSTAGGGFLGSNPCPLDQQSAGQGGAGQGDAGQNAGGS